MKPYHILSIVASVLFWVSGDVAAAPETGASAMFDKAYAALTRADDARDAGLSRDALAMYEEALRQHEELSAKHPAWQASFVGFRMNYCRNQIEALKKDVVEIVSRPVPPEKVMAAAKALAGARKALAHGKARQAQEKAIEVLKIAPDNGAARLVSGAAQCMAGKYEDAFHVLRTFVDEKPSNADARVLLAAAMFGLGRTSDARDELDRALVLAPESPEANYNMAIVMLHTVPPDKAKAGEYYRKAIKNGAGRNPKLENVLEIFGEQPAQ